MNIKMDPRSKRIFSVATNAVLEIMALEGRTVMTDNDASMVQVIRLALEQIAPDHTGTQTPALRADGSEPTAVQKTLEEAVAQALDNSEPAPPPAPVGISGFTPPAAPPAFLMQNGEPVANGPAPVVNNEVGAP